MKMIRYTNGKGKTTPFLSESPTSKELERLTIDELIVIAKRRRRLKKTLVSFLEGVKLK